LGFLPDFPMISGKSARKKIQNFFAGFLLYLLQVRLGDKELRGVILTTDPALRGTGGHG
jgi:hypothetical protein